MIKYIIIYIIFIIVFIKKTIKITISNIFINFFNIKIKVYGKNNLKNYNNLNLIIMSNHLNATDVAVIIHVLNYYTNQNKKIYTIAKADIFGNKDDDNIICNFLSIFKNNLFNKLNLIPYERGNKESGEKIKKNMLEIINNNNNILIFPEGECSRTGIPREFKPGSFKMCSENNIWILPITLKYDQDIGVNRTDKIYMSKWFNISAHMYIHTPIYNNNWEVLKNDVFNIITDSC